MAQTEKCLQKGVVAIVATGKADVHRLRHFLVKFYKNFKFSPVFGLIFAVLVKFTKFFQILAQFSANFMEKFQIFAQI